MRAPIYERLLRYSRSGRIPFAMPGHKNGRGLRPDLLGLDVTELGTTVDLHHRSPEVSESEEMLSRFYKSGQSRYLTGGSTAAIHAWAAAFFKSGDTIAAGRNCHISLINICALLGVDIVLLPGEIRSPQHIMRSPGHIPFDEFPEIAGVFLTSPDYYGQCADIASIAAQCRERGVPLFVDEAHGAHFAAGSFFPQTAMELGADFSVMSAHKTLSALTGAAYAHMREPNERFAKALTMVQTTSPSYPILASAELAWQQPGDKWDWVVRRCLRLRREPEVMENDDVTRLVLHFENISGHRALSELEKRGIDAEMADETNVVFIATPENTEEDFQALETALKKLRAIPGRYSPRFFDPPDKAVKIYPRRGYWHEEGYSPENIFAYPPGTPVVAMGEKIEGKVSEK